ncbi:MAG TPA: hypothetical protein VGD26_01925 [Chitinophagaceae bacterium]
MSKKIFLALLCIAFISCSRSNDDNPSTGDVVTEGNWRVTLFTDSGNNETSDFNGYSFSFNSNGSLVASSSTQNKSGTWNIDNSSNKFNINLGPKDDINKPLGELTYDWKIISITTSEIKLTDDNPASEEFLTFTKN